MTHTECMICGSTRLVKFLDLGLQPNGNAFPDEMTKDHEIKYPLSMSVCQDCWLVQLDDCPPPADLFTDHPYITSLNAPIVQHFQRLSRDIVEKFPIGPRSLIVDIGANDGTLLNAFRELGMRTLGVDPCQRTGKLAKAQGITVCETFWNQSAGRALRTLNLRPSVITATAVFYHVPELHEFVSGLAEVMDNRTVFATQCVYLKTVIEEIQFDHFYHEHTCVFLLRPLKELFARHGMRLLDVEFYDVHGGSFVLYVAKNSSPWQTTAHVDEAIQQEARDGLFCLETYRHFSNRVNETRHDLVTLLRGLRDQGKIVYALTAPVKGATLLNYCGVRSDLVSAAVEVNDFKIGRLMPGTHIPIIGEDQVGKQPDYYLVLAWNFLDFFVQKHQAFFQAGGRFIVPHPNVRVLDQHGVTEWNLQCLADRAEIL